MSPDVMFTDFSLTGFHACLPQDRDRTEPVFVSRIARVAQWFAPLSRSRRTFLSRLFDGTAAIKHPSRPAHFCQANFSSTVSDPDSLEISRPSTRSPLFAHRMGRNTDRPQNGSRWDSLKDLLGDAHTRDAFSSQHQTHSGFPLPRFLALQTIYTIKSRPLRDLFDIGCQSKKIQNDEERNAHQCIAVRRMPDCDR